MHVMLSVSSANAVLMQLRVFAYLRPVLVSICSLQCASKVNGGGFSSSKEFPDEVLRFLRSHPVMYQPVLPQHHRPVLLQTEPGRRRLTQIAVDRVQAQDGHYHVLYIGTGLETFIVLNSVGLYTKVVTVLKLYFLSISCITFFCLQESNIYASFC